MKYKNVKFVLKTLVIISYVSLFIVFISSQISSYHNFSIKSFFKLKNIKFILTKKHLIKRNFTKFAEESNYLDYSKNSDFSLKLENKNYICGSSKFIKLLRQTLTQNKLFNNARKQKYKNNFNHTNNNIYQDDRYILFCGYERQTNRLRQINRVMKIASQTNRSIILFDYRSIYFDDYINIPLLSKHLKERSGNQNLRFLNQRDLNMTNFVTKFIVSYIQTYEAWPFDSQVYCAHCKSFSGDRYCPIKYFNKIEQLIQDSSQLIVLSACASYYFKQKNVPNFFIPFRKNIEKNVEKFLLHKKVIFNKNNSTLKRNVSQQVNVDIKSNKTSTLGLHIRLDDKKHEYDIEKFILFVKNKSLEQNAVCTFIGTDANSYQINKFHKLWEKAMIGTQPIFGQKGKCENSPYDECKKRNANNLHNLSYINSKKGVKINDEVAIMDQIALSMTDHFVGLLSSTYSMRIIDMRRRRKNKNPGILYDKIIINVPLDYE